MARPKKIIPDEEVKKVVEESVKSTENEAVKSVGATVLMVEYGGGQRLFSISQHGERFKENAEEFAKKFNGTVRKIA